MSDIHSLVPAAAEVRLLAHAPYSRFKVGAALRATDGQVYVGCNVENVAYPEGTCAETGAIAAMVAGGSSRIAALVVIADCPDPISPCGGCRQRIAEFADADVPLLLVTTDGAEIQTTVGAMLPGAFNTDHISRTMK